MEVSSGLAHRCIWPARPVSLLSTSIRWSHFRQVRIWSGVHCVQPTYSHGRCSQRGVDEAAGFSGRTWQPSFPGRAGQGRPGVRLRAEPPYTYKDKFGKEHTLEGYPKPSERFTRKDRKRIKSEGPKVQDLFVKDTFETVDKDTGEEREIPYSYVPPEVVGDAYLVDEPEWDKLPNMPFMEFYHGLRQRNWTSQYYDAQAEPWKLEFFRDSGRLLRPSYPGFRAVVTQPDGHRFWVDMPEAGNETFLYDNLALGTQGGNWRTPRTAPRNVTLWQYGYNQVFEQLFQAYEQKLPKKALRDFQRDFFLDVSKYKYNCPADEKLQLMFKTTPAEPTLFWLRSELPTWFFYIFSFSFLVVCLGIGIFKPRKQMPNDPQQAIEFAQSKGQARKEGRTNVRFADVAGAGPTLKDLQDVVEFLKNPTLYGRLGAKPPKGILLEGDPGTGKTLIAKAIAGEAGVPFYQMAGSEFVEAIVGVGAARVRDLFKRARVQEEPCIIFVDEIDALGTKRAQSGEKTNEEREQTLNQLLSEMDGFTPDLGVVFIAATNRSDLLDPALMRPGRFDRKIRILRPDTEGRYEILKVHARKRPLADDVDLMQVARDLPGLSGAELANIMNEAALEAGRRKSDNITNADVYNGIDRILQGVRRPSLRDSLRSKWRFAVHESGKAVVATLLRQAIEASGRTSHLEVVERVSIVPRGRDWTRTTFLRGSDEDYTMSTRARFLARLRVIVAGRAAEEVLLEEGVTSYSRPDMADATELATKIVANYGMSDLGITMYAPNSSSVGFMRKSFEVAVDNIDADLYGREIKGAMFQPSDQTYHRIKATAFDLVRAAYADAVAVLETHREGLNAVADALWVEEELLGERLEEVLAAHPPAAPIDVSLTGVGERPADSPPPESREPALAASS